MTFREAVDRLNRDDRFKATVSAMNTLLVEKGVYTQQEFEDYFCQWTEAENKRESKGRSAAQRSASG
jgi:hypothetical protein